MSSVLSRLSIGGITLHLTGLAGRDDLEPGPAVTQRAAFLGRPVFIVANLYPTFTCADEPERFVKPGGEEVAMARNFKA